MTKPRALPLLFLALALAACASEGGVSGTGLSAIVAGHVISGQGDARAGVEVSIAGGDSASTTDAAGNFELAGEIAGDVELRFSDAGGAELGTLRLSVPPGSTTVIEEVVVTSAGGAPSVTSGVVRQGSVIGRIRNVNCLPGGRRATIELGNGMSFPFFLADPLVVRGPDGAALDCGDLRRTDRIEATGIQLANGDSIALSIAITDRAPEPLAEIDVEFGGSVNDLDCAASKMRVIVLTDDDPYLARVQGRLGTELQCIDVDGPHPCDCQDISPRDVVQVRGVATVAEPDAVRAASILVFPGPAIVDVPVVALRVGCAVRKIETAAEFAATRQVVIARFDEDTDFVCDDTACDCADLRPGDQLRLIGSPIVSSGRPFIDSGTVVRERRGE